MAKDSKSKKSGTDSSVEVVEVKPLDDESSEKEIADQDRALLHYKLTERTDAPFWERCRTMEVPESLAHRIELFRASAHVYQAPGELFQVDSWLQVMLGQRLEPQGRHLMGRLMPPEQLGRALDDLKGNIARAVARLPSHQAFLESYVAASEAVPA